MTAFADRFGTAAPLTVGNRRGRRIRIVRHDPPGRAPRRVVVLTGGFGMTLRPTIGPALRLAAAGFTVLRFAVTNAPGPSDGDMLDFCLTGAQEDLCDVSAWAVGALGVPAVAVYAMSITGRAALRVPARAAGTVAAVAAVSCVVDVRSTMRVINGGVDVVGDWERAAPGPARDEATGDLLGHAIRSHGIADMVRARWADEDTTRDDLRRAGPVPVLAAVGTDDAWVSPATARRCFAAAGSASSLRLVPGMAHMPSDQALDEVLPWIADGFGRVLGGGAAHGPAPDDDDMRAQRHRDREMERRWAREAGPA